MTLQQQMEQAVHEWVATGGSEDKESAIQAILEMPEYAALPYLIRNRPFLTSSKIKAFKECAYHARLKYLDEIDMGFEQEDYFTIGSAVDTWLTNGEQSFRDRYLVGSKTSKDFKALVEQHPGKPTLTPSSGKIVERAVKEFGTRDFFPRQPKKRNVLFLLHGLPCKVELDHFDPETRRIGDVKTCASITNFDPDMHKLQMAFYAFAIEKRWGEKVEAELYVIDKHSDWSRSHKWVYSHQTLQMHFYEVESLAAQWKDSVDSGIFPHVDVSTDAGLRTAWSSEYWSICPFCKQAQPTTL